jgi:glycine betaine/proline transport system substrate-binding protein
MLLAALAALVIVAGCGGGSGGGGQSGGGGELALGVAGGWTENEAISNLSKVLLEEEVGYDEVTVETADLGLVFQGVASGDYDAFQDVWMPNHAELLEEVEPDVQHLDPWFEGETAYGIAVPDYMEVRSLQDLDEAETDMIIGIEPSAAFMPWIAEEVIPAYGLDVKLVESSTPAMLTELDRAYRAREPIIFLGWSPHWMNAEYDFRYLEDPKDAQGPFNDPSELSTIVRDGLKEDDPVAYELIRSISLTEQQVNALEAEILEARDPVTGVKSWLAENRDVVEPWIEAAETTEES